MARAKVRRRAARAAPVGAQVNEVGAQVNEVLEKEAANRRGRVGSGSQEDADVVVKPVASWIRELTEETVESFGIRDAERFVLRELLGEGGFGSVYRCSLETQPGRGEKDRPSSSDESTGRAEKDQASSHDENAEAGPSSDQDFAVKVVNCRRLALVSGCSLEVVCPKVQREIEILTHLGSHARLVKLHYAFYTQGTARFYLVSELLRGGDLFTAIVRRGKPFHEKDAHMILDQLVEAVAYCHSRQVAHRDLKLENCLLEAPDSLSVKVCDYGQSKFFGNIQDQAKTLTTTPAYTAPEVKQAVQDDRPYDAYKADVFSLGVILYCLLCNALPADTDKRLYEHHHAWQGLSPSVKGLIGRLLAANFDQRPHAEEIFGTDWMQQRIPSHELTMTATSSTGHATCEKEQTRLVLEALISTQCVVDALQRERSSCCDPTLREIEFYWQMRHTDEKLLEGSQIVARASEHQPGESAGAWKALKDELATCAQQVTSLRVTTWSLMEERGAPRPSGLISAEEERTDVFGAYHPMLTRLIATLAGVLQTCRVFQGSPHESWRPVLRLRFLLLANEQLARERGYLAGHLKQPESLCTPPILLALAEIIGARKLLIGGFCDAAAAGGGGRRTEPHIVAAAGGGLLQTLDLAEDTLLEGADLTALARAELHVLTRHDGIVDQTAVSELYYLLLELADKVHQLMLIGLLELFSPPSYAPPALPDW